MMDKTSYKDSSDYLNVFAADDNERPHNSRRKLCTPHLVALRLIFIAIVANHGRGTVLGSRRNPIREHLASSSPISLEDFMKPKSGNRRDRSRSKTITTTSSDDKLSSYPYTSDIEHLVETSPQKPGKEDSRSAAPELELDEGYAETLNATVAEVDQPQEVRTTSDQADLFPELRSQCIDCSVRFCPKVHASRRCCRGHAVVIFTGDVDNTGKLQDA